MRNRGVGKAENLFARIRYRGEHLMMDMHKIRLYQSTWEDAQRLMNRWGSWGHYKGNCTAADCSYRISMSDLTFYNAESPQPDSSPGIAALGCCFGRGRPWRFTLDWVPDSVRRRHSGVG